VWFTFIALKVVSNMLIIHANHNLSIDFHNQRLNTGILIKANILSEAINLIEILQLYNKNQISETHQNSIAYFIASSEKNLS
jgi:hypothetical protein